MALGKSGKDSPHARRGVFFAARDGSGSDKMRVLAFETGGIRNRDGGGSGNVLAADHLVDVGLAGEDHKGGLDDTAAKAEHEVERRLLLDVVVREVRPSSSCLPMKMRRCWSGDTFLVLDLRLHVVDGVRRLHLQGDGLTRDCVDGKRMEGSVFGRLFVKGRGGTRRRARAPCPGREEVGRIVVTRRALSGSTGEGVASTPPAKQETRITPQTWPNPPRAHRATRSLTRRITAADALGARERPRTRGNRHHG